MPAGRPIYFSVDFDAQLSQQAVINDYFDGVASVLGRARTGAYVGSSRSSAVDAGKITFGGRPSRGRAGGGNPARSSARSTTASRSPAARAISTSRKGR